MIHRSTLTLQPPTRQSRWLLQWAKWRSLCRSGWPWQCWLGSMDTRSGRETPGTAAPQWWSLLAAGQQSLSSGQGLGTHRRQYSVKWRPSIVDHWQPFTGSARHTEEITAEMEVYTGQHPMESNNQVSRIHNAMQCNTTLFIPVRAITFFRALCITRVKNMIQDTYMYFY